MTDYSNLIPVMEKFIQKKMRADKVPGLTIAVVDDQRIIWSKGFGDANRGDKKTINTETRFRAGSITKLFTAIAIMQLVEQGKIDIHKSLKTYLPKFKINSRYGSTDDITILSILQHTSGLPSDYITGMWSNHRYTSDTPYTQLIEQIQSEYVSYPANTAWSYSNIGFSLLGQVIQNVSNLTYQDYVTRNILQPLEMQRSDINQVLSGDNISASYGIENYKPIKELALRDTPAGGLNSTVHDLAHLLMMVNANGHYSNNQILKRTTLESMYSTVELSSSKTLSTTGLSWFIDDSGTLLGGKQRLIGHEGATIGHGSTLKLALDSKLGVVILANTLNNSINEISDLALKTAYEIKYEKKVAAANKQHQNCSITEDIDVSGSYILPDFGLITLEHKHKKWQAKAFGLTMNLKQRSNGLYGFNYKWLGIVKTSLDEIDDLALCFKKRKNNFDVIAYYQGQAINIAQKIMPTSISETWRERLGVYTTIDTDGSLLSLLGTSSLKSELVLEDGLLIIQSANTPIKTVLLPINDTQAIIAGYGRTLGETVQAIENKGEETLIHAGNTLKKLSD